MVKLRRKRGFKSIRRRMVQNDENTKWTVCFQTPSEVTNPERNFTFYRTAHDTLIINVNATDAQEAIDLAKTRMIDLVKPMNPGGANWRIKSVDQQ